MTWPGGRRTRHVTVYLSPAEFEIWEAVRAAEIFPSSRADMLMEWLIPRCEELAAGSTERVRPRCAAALAALDREAKPTDLRSYWGRVARPPQGRS